MRTKKTAATFRLLPTTLKRLRELAEKGCTTKTAVLEILINRAAKEARDGETKRPNS